MLQHLDRACVEPSTEHLLSPHLHPVSDDWEPVSQWTWLWAGESWRWFIFGSAAISPFTPHLDLVTKHILEMGTKQGCVTWLSFSLLCLWSELEGGGITKLWTGGCLALIEKSNRRRKGVSLLYDSWCGFLETHCRVETKLLRFSWFWHPRERQLSVPAISWLASPAVRVQDSVDVENGASFFFFSFFFLLYKLAQHTQNRQSCSGFMHQWNSSVSRERRRVIPVTWTHWPKFYFQERHPGDSKNYNECIRHETIRVAVCDMLEGKCPCPEPLRYGKEAGREHKKTGVGKQVKILWLLFLTSWEVLQRREVFKSSCSSAKWFCFFCNGWLHLCSAQELCNDQSCVTVHSGCILWFVFGKKCAFF